jgi:tetratricopeptide (TPR) repeat protein
MDIESSCSNLLHVEEISRNVCRFERPNDVFALKHCGEAYLMLDIYQEALADLNKQLKIWPNDTWTLSRRVATYCMLKKYQETFADLNKSLEIRLNDVFALKHRGEAYRMLCKY